MAFWSLALLLVGTTKESRPTVRPHRDIELSTWGLFALAHSSKHSLASSNSSTNFLPQKSRLMKVAGRPSARFFVTVSAAFA